MEIQYVEPDDGLVGPTAVIVPASLRRQDQVRGFHRATLPIDSRVATTVALNHKAERSGAVPMGTGDLAG
jgi:hypothetical protein